MQQKYWIVIIILALAFLAGNFVYPTYFDKSVDFLNSKFSFLHLPHFWSKPYVLGLDLQGGVMLTYQADLSEVADKSGSMAGLRDVIERRINLFGVTEPVVQIQGDNRLLVELPGVTDVKQAIEMIGQTPYLEFNEERTVEESQQIIDKKKRLRKLKIMGQKTLQK